jgi:enoyl-CoA hydratase
VVEVVLEAPGKNALSRSLMERTLEAVGAADGAPLLLTGHGDAFSAGLNLKEVASLDVAGMRTFLETLMDLTEALFRYPGPTVAAINGHAIAGGLILALVCDHRVVTSNPRARLGLNEVALGLRFPPRLLDTVRYRVPAQHHEAVMLQGPLVGPVDALRLGLADESADDVGARGRAVLEGLAKLPSSAYAAMKDDLRGAVGRDDAGSHQRFIDEVLPVWTGDELKQRIARFL